MESGPTSAQEDPLTVYLVTAEPGEAIWERFGHNGLWIHDDRTGEDVFWEWGLFSFSQRGFIPRLARGTMLYSMGGRPLSRALAVYRRQDRNVWAQELALTPDQERSLDQFVRNNALPENRQYIYDYYRDNCSTRVRDALDLVLGGRLRAEFAGEETGRTWRWHTRRLLRPAPLADAGLQIVLGSPGDREIDAWQEMFLPMKLRERVASAVVPLENGDTVPLVRGEMRLVEGIGGPGPQEPAHRFPFAVVLGVLLGLWTALLGWWAARSTLGRRALGLWMVAWGGVLGSIGMILAVAWLFTDHVFWRWNENLLMANPVLLAVPFLALPLLAGREPPRRLLDLLRWVSWIALAAVALKLVPGIFVQQNWGIVAALVPSHLMMARVLPLPTADPT
ncbi:MAG: DUF4105 domain-containing protein [Gemmatimonadota bacterium]